MLCERKGIIRKKGNERSYSQYREEQYDRLADILRAAMDIDEIYRMIGVK
jgi:cobyric acid synthase